MSGTSAKSSLTNLREWCEYKGSNRFPCVVSGCWVEVVEGHSLCAEHELRFIAQHGHMSPKCGGGQQSWNNLLATLEDWYK
jgi:hypothetical protein